MKGRRRNPVERSHVRTKYWSNGASLTRRKALAKLGLAASVVYAAPVLTRLSGARADDYGGDGNQGNRPPWRHRSKPSYGRGHGGGGRDNGGDPGGYGGND